MCSASSPRAAMLYYAGCEEHQEEPHFLQSCFLCNKPLGFNCDIFMYRGDTAFCSKECRQEQIEIDEAKERKSRKLSFSSSFSSSSSSSSSTSTTSAASSSSNSSRNSETKANKTVRTGTVAVA